MLSKRNITIPSSTPYPASSTTAKFSHSHILNKSEDSTAETLDVPEKDVKATQNNVVATPTTCNTCKTKFESL